MYLSKIELFGFKSFAHRVRISFDKGLTAIVGPNGCGKTNVVDAIRWVLGEQKSQLLRSPKMENIIFNGTKSLKPLSFTEVSITIQNTRNVLPTEYTEVTVTRRLYRSGDSDYLLNQVPCRLKDILDLFADTGMGSDAYSVIELKMIEEIISNKSEERMKLFEEAAGITRYKQRRKQTFRQLESASRDLSRVDDVLAEVEKKVRSLKLQVKKAERLKEIREELRSLDLELSGIGMGELHGKLRPLLDSVAAEERQSHELAAQIATLDSTHQESELRQLNLEQRLAEAQKELNSINSVVHDHEKLLLQHREKQKSLRLSIERLGLTSAEKQRKLAEQEALSVELAGLQAPLDTACSEQLQRHEQLRTQMEDLNAGLDKRRRELQEVRQRSSELLRSVNALNLARQSLLNRKEHVAGSIAKLEQRRRELEEVLERADPERRETETQLTSKRAQLNELRERQKVLSTRKSALFESMEGLKERMLALRGDRDRLQNQVILCDSILEKFEGLPEGVAYLEKHREGKPGIGCLSDQLSLQPEHKKAVNTALGESLGYYICRSLDEAKVALSSLVRSDKGKVHFLVLDLVEGSSVSDYPPIGGSVRAVDVVGCPEEMSKALLLLLQHCYIVPDMATAESLAATNPEARFVTADGEKFTAKGLIFGGSAKGSDSLRLGRRAERDRLQKEVKRVASSIGEIDTELEGLRKELDGIRLDELRRQTGAVDQEIVSLEKRLSRLEAEKHSRAEQLKRSAEEAAALSGSIKGADTELDGIGPEFERLRAEELELQQRLASMQESLSEEENASRTLNGELQLQHGRYRDAQLEREKLGFRIGACRQAVTTLFDELAALLRDREEAEKEVASLDSSIAVTSEELEQARFESGRRQQALNELESAYRELQSKNHEALSVLRDMRRKHEVSMQMLLELGNQKTRVEQEIDHIRTTVMERYGVELEPMPSLAPEGFDPVKSKERLLYLQKQREQFGAVNELALEEYEIEHERFEFLTSQKEDLVNAEQQLRETIEEINRTALEKFRQTFTEVRKNFIRIFHDLFDPEDEVDLLIHTDDDPLEAHIEIVAKPRGKKPLAIEQLSGGEKALTALSLLFAIYLVKPSPFCILDEVDAPLDDANVGRFTKLLKKFENNTQFIIVTHNKKSMASCQALYGVTMEEEGVSKLIPVKIEKIRSEEEVSS
ncbi:MAG: chromosome segregation protein SMC [Chlorobiaceae bacterium]|nr:chromosome segregation protein SMC [Chlorobiaceae bacterium]NTW74374.1 chromosome segregation protein SMC [Chlorobiaceae bacterium]